MKNKSSLRALSFCILVGPALAQASPGWKCLDVDRRFSNAGLTVKAATEEIDKAQESIKSIEKTLAKISSECANLSGPQCSPGYRQNLQMNLQASMQKRAQVSEIRGKTQIRLTELTTLKQDCKGKKIEMVQDIPESLKKTLR